MASSVCAEHGPASWLNYFFLYDSSKVKGEGDPTRAGINYFYPSQTILDQQELLCGQIAGVVRCMSDIAGSPPNLIRLRKLKFAIHVHGDYLWALGCSVDVADVSCKRFLEELIGLFRFYNGPFGDAYTVRSSTELGKEWELYTAHIQRNASDLHKIFNSLCHLDKTKVDPLLLLKAALILQTCQRFHHVLAGCILYKGRIVSTQLPPPLSSKVLIQREEHIHRITRYPKCLHDPVFVTEAEATALRQFPAQWMTRLPTSSRRTSRQSHSLTGDAHVNQSQISVAAEVWTLVKEKGNLESAPLLKVEFSKEPAVAHVENEDVGVSEASCIDPVADNPMQSSSRLKELQKPEMTGEHEQVTIIADSPDNCFFEEPPITESDIEIRSQHLSSGSFVTCDSMPELEKNSPDKSGSSTKEDDQETFHPCAETSDQSSSDGRLSGHTADVTNVEQAEGKVQAGLMKVDLANELMEIKGGDTEVHERNASSSEKISPSCESTDINLSTEASSITDWTLTLNSTPSASSTKLVQMALYIHNVNGLVLSLLAECPFKYDKESIQDVHDSTLASLNGLEVHLKETLPLDNNVTKATYSFTHYDSIQNVLTANLPSVSSTYDLHFLRAASLIHSDFNQHQTIQEITVRNACSALYGCQSTVHETYFQQVAPPIRNSGVPNSKDSAFMLPNKAKQKLLRHGLNLL
ncbi:hypothetical protein FKM82_005229 [Ascaphus truei]